MTTKTENKLSDKLDNLTDIITAHIEKDEAWKKEAQPIIDAGKRIKSWGTVSMAMILIFGTIVGIVAGIVRIIKG